MFLRRVFRLFKPKIILKGFTKPVLHNAALKHFGHQNNSETKANFRDSINKDFVVSQLSIQPDFSFVSKSDSIHVLEIDKDEINIDEIPLSQSIIIGEPDRH